MRFYFSWKVSLICLLLIVGMLRLSYWQWTRHLDKLNYIEQMQQRLAVPEEPLMHLITEDSESDWSKLLYRRALVAGQYDFDNEVILQNRSYQEHKGVHVLTPLKVAEDFYLLVDRGFLPLHLAKPDQRKKFHQPKTVKFQGLIKEPKEKNFFLAPSDPETGRNLPRVDAFLRVDLKKIAAQLPYKLLPFYVEIMNTTEQADVADQIVKSSSGKSEIFFLPSSEGLIKDPSELLDKNLPIPTFNTVIPAGRHFGYVFEWGFMALGTLLIGFILQLRPPRQTRFQPPPDKMDI